MDKGIIDKICILPPFRDLSRSVLERSLRYFQYALYRKAKALFYQEDLAELAFFIVSGKTRQIKWRSDESTILLGCCGAGEWLGLPETLTGSPYLCDCICESETEVLSIHASNLKVLLNDPLLQESITASLAKGHFTLHRILTAPGPAELITQLLERLSKNDGWINITQEEIAAAVALTRETVSKHIHILEREGLLEFSRGKIRLIRN